MARAPDPPQKRKQPGAGCVVVAVVLVGAFAYWSAQAFSAAAIS
jgi:hypothetical protein